MAHVAVDEKPADRPSTQAASTPLIEALRRRFGCDFAVWSKQHVETGAGDDEKQRRRLWQPLPGTIALDASCSPEHFDAILEESMATEQPVVRELPHGQLLLTVPVETDDRTSLAALGVTTADASSLAAQLASSVLSEQSAFAELSLRENDIRLFAEQLANNYEELAWFRSLVENLQFCTATNKLEHVAERAFPALRNNLKAEAVAWVRPVGGRAIEIETVEDSPSYEFPVWVGREVISRRNCSEFIACIAPGAVKKPFVWNFQTGFQQPPREEAGEDLRSCILVPVCANAHHYGWLLALNRLGADTPLKESLGNDEFGTVEATLMESAARMLATHAANVSLFAEQRNLVVNVIRAMVNILEARDEYTCGHSDRVALMARQLAVALNVSSKEQEYIYLAGLLHDIGKVGIPDDILLKPGRLTDEEFARIKEHPERGVRILRHFRQFEPILPGVLHHHEAFDGSGYPHGLRGEEIPFMGRLLAVVDTYDAVTTCRPYRTAKSHEDALSILKDGAGKQWDARIVKCFLTEVDTILDYCNAWETHMHDIIDGDATVFDDVEQAIDDSVIIGSHTGIE